MQQKPTIAPWLFKELQRCPDKFYKLHKQAKTKYGKPQIDKHGDVRMREITKPVYRLKLAQQGLNSCLQNFELPDCMYGGITHRNHIENAIPHKNNQFFLSVDLRNFFGNITNYQVNKTLINIGLTYKEARLITRLTTYKGSLPQGAPTSTTLANLAFAPTASLLEEYCFEKGITFTVYVDDLSFSSMQCFKHDIDEIIQILKDGGFYVNHNKIHYRTNNSEITGIDIKNGKLSIHKKVVSNADNPDVKKYISMVYCKYNAHFKSFE